MDKQLKELLTQKKLKCTRSRVAILRVLHQADKPLDFEEIKAKLTIKTDKATFYRNMIKFEEKGIIVKFESPQRKWYFELAKDQHAHFICENCNKISCIDLEIPKNLQNLHVSSMLIKGQCKECHEAQ